MAKLDGVTELDKQVEAIVEHDARQICVRTGGDDKTAYGLYPSGFEIGGLDKLKAACVGPVRFGCRAAIRDVYGGRDGQVETLALGEEEIYMNPFLRRALEVKAKRETAQ